MPCTAPRLPCRQLYFFLGWVDCSHRANREFFTIISFNTLKRRLSSSNVNRPFRSSCWYLSLPFRYSLSLSLSSLLILTKLSLTQPMTGFYEVFVMLARLFSCSPFKSLSVVLQMYTIKSFLSSSPFLRTFLWLLIALLSVNDERTFCSRRKKLELIRIQR